MHELIIAFGLMLILEGIMPALFPNRWQQYLKKIAGESASSIRAIGIVLIILGWLIVLLNK